VSHVDRDAESAIAEVIRSRHPDASLLAEEFSPNAGSSDGLMFVADPLDGTTNFLHGFPWYAVSIAAVVDGSLEAGVVLNAATGELFTATEGGGARANGQPITVSIIDDPRRALIGTGFPFKRAEQDLDRYMRALPGLMRDTAGLRRPGSAALDLACVAAGRFDAFFEFSLAPWDIAAGILLIREAGGIVTDASGAPAPIDHTSIIAGNTALHAWLLDRLGDDG
jgi:myo-inositol-1(or 4)-monophosphatase